MTNNARVFNVTRRFSLKYKQALKAVENCACAWVEIGVSIRDLTLAESITARNKQAQQREPLAFAEIPGLIFQPPIQSQATHRQSFGLIVQANKFANATPS